MGQITSLQDPGGTVTYAYFGNGNMKTANYGGSVQTLEQDGWGRKTKLTDPSAGIYTYEYNGYGEVTKETTPQGQYHLHLCRCYGQADPKSGYRRPYQHDHGLCVRCHQQAAYHPEPYQCRWQ
ncbi:MAG: RHS repeat protein [Nitrospiraceae bacterium]|nr:RHS repeat protein [Nitrospiraceae bacterium]